MKKIVLVLVMTMMMVTTGFALERPWEKEAGKESKGSFPGNSMGQSSTPYEIPLDNALVMGNRNAQFKVIVFTDPDCPFCAKLHQEMKTVLQQRNDIVFFLKLYPLAFHKEAYGKSKTIVCENSLKLLEANFNKELIPKTDCESREIDDNIKLAKTLGINSVPTMIFANGDKVSGAKSSYVIIKLVEENQAKR